MCALASARASGCARAWANARITIFTDATACATRTADSFIVSIAGAGSITSQSVRCVR